MTATLFIAQRATAAILVFAVSVHLATIIYAVRGDRARRRGRARRVPDGHPQPGRQDRRACPRPGARHSYDLGPSRPRGGILARSRTHRGGGVAVSGSGSRRRPGISAERAVMPFAACVVPARRGPITTDLADTEYGFP